ncbi:hypothetical protein CPB86DRAFT_277910 [Serendipita vermifera]|nr:hypothetical protein CPB86DRAFT_277910 [Serendipita vermifera]
MDHHDFYGFTNITNHATSTSIPSAVQSLDALLAFHLPTLQSQHLSPAQAGAQVWSNQTTPELAASIGHGSPLLATPGTTSVNPITNAIDQSMVGVSSNGESKWPDVTVGNYPTTTTTASGSGVEGGYPSLPPLYDAVGNVALNSLASLNGGGVVGGGGGSITGASPHPAQTTSDGSLAPIDSHYNNTLLTSLHHSHHHHHHHHHPHRTSLSGASNSPANPDANSNGNSTGVTVGPVPSSSSATTTQSLPTPASASLLNLSAISPPAGSQCGLPRLPIDAQLIRKQVFYYFNRVRKMQYTFAGESTKDVLRDIVVSNNFFLFLSYCVIYTPFLFCCLPCVLRVLHPLLLNSKHCFLCFSHYGVECPCPIWWDISPRKRDRGDDPISDLYLSYRLVL